MGRLPAGGAEARAPEVGRRRAREHRERVEVPVDPGDPFPGRPRPRQSRNALDLVSS